VHSKARALTGITGQERLTCKVCKPENAVKLDEQNATNVNRPFSQKAPYITSTVSRTSSYFFRNELIRTDTRLTPLYGAYIAEVAYICIYLHTPQLLR